MNSITSYTKEENSNEERPAKKRKIEEPSIFDDPAPPTNSIEVTSSTSEDSSVAREELNAFAGHEEEYTEPLQNNTEEELMVHSLH